MPFPPPDHRVSNLFRGVSLPDHLESFRTALADRYAIERELGRGGNAIVYLAHDLKHDRKVALKVINPELALAVRAERFLREIQIAAKLSHPHILTLIDSGQAGETVFYVMPFVEGESLRDRLRREKQLPLEDALRICREVADALDYAHRHGIVHRDIKPENILLHAGHPVVMDFGIARALTGAAADGLTEGVVVGTPAYMSPEQGAAGGDVDARSDIYSLGCVLYEMLAGHPPFEGRTAQEVMGRHTLDPVPTIRAARSGVPEGIERAVIRALAKQPVDRFATASDLMAALSKPSGATTGVGRKVAVLAAVAIVGVLLLSFTPNTLRRAGWLRSEKTDSAGHSLAVLPCVNLSNNSENSYLSEAIAEELILGLNRVPGLRVKGRTSSFAINRDSPDPVREAASQLGVSRVVDCSVREQGDQLRIGVKLNNAQGEQLWAEVFQGAAADAFALEEKVARAVTAQISASLLQDAAPAVLVRRYTPSPEARRLYQMGQHFMHQRNTEMRKALGYFEQAVAIDTMFALAYSGLSDAYTASAAGRNFAPLRGEAAQRHGKAMAEKAVFLDSTAADAWVSLARARYILDWDFPGAEEAFQRAIALEPKNAAAHSWYGHFLAWVMSPAGRSKDAIDQAGIGLELDPLTPQATGVMGQALRFAGRPAEALPYYQTALELGGGSNYRTYLASVLLDLERYQEALAQLDTIDQGRAKGAKPGGEVGGLRGYAYARTGRVTEAKQILRMLENAAREGRQNAWLAMAHVDVGLGNRDEAFAALNQAVDTKNFTAGPSFNELLQSALRDDPRWELLLRKVGIRS